MPHANVVQGEALDIIRLMSFDVLIGNLPNRVTESLLRLIPELTFRVAVLAVGEFTDLDQSEPHFSWTEVEKISWYLLRSPRSPASRASFELFLPTKHPSVAWR